MKKGKIFSGMQPTGDLHIGNYMGALRNWTALLDSYDSIFCIVDLHAITIEYDVSLMPERVLNTAIQYIASGLDPEKCTIFVQSAVPAHTELAWILNSLTPLGQLERMTQFKDKSSQHKSNINAGLFTYPILQTADILLYKAHNVPVGDDQVQHIELARSIARKFNKRYGKCFPEPKPLLSSAPRIMGLDGISKMSKSKNNHIALTDSEDVVKKKLSKAVTDPARVRRDDPGTPEKCNIYALHKIFSDTDTQNEVAQGCRSAGIGCFDCKMKLNANISKELSPVRRNIIDLETKKDYIKEVLDEGRKRCLKEAQATMDEVKEKMGL